jgi:hypothetical protein
MTSLTLIVMEIIAKFAKVEFKEIVNLKKPYITWWNFPKVERTFGKLNGTLIFTI